MCIRDSCYVEAQKRLPSKEIELETKEGTFYFFKAGILSNQVSYSTDKNFPANLVTISGKRAFEVILSLIHILLLTRAPVASFGLQANQTDAPRLACVKPVACLLYTSRCV